MGLSTSLLITRSGADRFQRRCRAAIETVSASRGYQARPRHLYEGLTMFDDPSTVPQLIAHSPPDIVPIIGVFIPIVAIVMGLGIGMLKLYLDYRKKRELIQLHHAERMAAIDKGIELPSLPPEFFQEYRRPPLTNTTYLRRGLMWLLLGIAVTVALAATHNKEYWWGLVPAAVGVANLLTYFLATRDKQPPGDDKAGSRPS
jgi:hypothetical protein